MRSRGENDLAIRNCYSPLGLVDFVFRRKAQCLRR